MQHRFTTHFAAIGTLRCNDGDGDGNLNVKTAIGLMGKTTTLQVQHGLISGLMEDVNKPLGTFLSLSELGTLEFNSRRVRLHLTK